MSDLIFIDTDNKFYNMNHSLLSYSNKARIVNVIYFIFQIKKFRNSLSDFYNLYNNSKIIPIIKKAETFILKNGNILDVNYENYSDNIVTIKCNKWHNYFCLRTSKDCFTLEVKHCSDVIIPIHVVNSLLEYFDYLLSLDIDELNEYFNDLKIEFGRKYFEE